MQSLIHITHGSYIFGVIFFLDVLYSFGVCVSVSCSNIVVDVDLTHVPFDSNIFLCFSFRLVQYARCFSLVSRMERIFCSPYGETTSQ